MGAEHEQTPPAGFPEAEPHPPIGAESTREPNPKQDPEAERWAEGPKRDEVDD
jgi:hypothetical protein